MPKPRQPRMGRPVTISAKATVGVRLPQAMAAKLASYAKARGVTVSEAVRWMIEKAFAKNVAKTPRRGADRLR